MRLRRSDWLLHSFFPAINRDNSSCAAPEKLSVFLQRFPSKAVKTQVRRRIYSGTFYKFLQERRNVLLTLLRRNMYTVLSGEDGCSRHTDTIFTRGKRSLSCNELFWQSPYGAPIRLYGTLLAYEFHIITEVSVTQLFVSPLEDKPRMQINSLLLHLVRFCLMCICNTY